MLACLLAAVLLLPPGWRGGTAPHPGAHAAKAGAGLARE
jgi:hypothetical protein